MVRIAVISGSEATGVAQATVSLDDVAFASCVGWRVAALRHPALTIPSLEMVFFSIRTADSELHFGD
jgi:hypothetical protein